MIWANGIATGRLRERRISLSDHDTMLLERPAAGPPLVLVHGAGLDRAMWSALLGVLDPAVPAVAYDLRGHGSASQAPGPLTYERLAADLRDLLDQLAVSRARVVGLSLGGQVVQRFAIDHPGRVEALALVCTRASPFPPFAALADAAERDGMGPQVEAALGRWFSPEARARGDEGVLYVRERLSSLPPSRWAWWLRLIARFDALEQLAAIEAPTTVVAAELDGVASPQHMADIAAGVPGAELHVVPGGRHLLCFEHRDELAALLSPPAQA